MKVLYTAPTRAHHYKYAASLQQQGALYKFVSGFSRLSPRAELPEVGDNLVRQDWIQTVFLASLRFNLPAKFSAHLAYLAKKELDWACKKLVDDADIFIFYNGAGLNTAKYAKQKGIITIVEAVNSHVSYQEQLLKEEYELSHIPWLPFHKAEKKRRIEEYEVADFILMPSEFVKRSFIKYGFPEKKLIKVPYGFNSLTLNTVVPGKKTDEFNILYVGSVSVRKGLRYLIEAFKMVKHPKKRLTIVGPPNTPDGLAGITIPENVIFTGVLKGAELENVYQNASVFCLPSIEEGLALVLGEALSYGIPIVATENTGADDLITDGKEGFIVPIRDSTSIAAKIQQLADDSELYDRVKANAVNRASSLKGWDESGKMLKVALDKILAEKFQGI
ncbi:glycosyltransferase family 4 protein [Mucilaginibacter sp. RS28]|uniref:Glycosyltransferase family 4 protein n=1 Tax=Mucilaginibacter straminoryzae TaxID=2932774 RepID=A0A9X1X530_9SPHI|nr:glycosyltransferase family 4 protein [Mucilaginibacter straminoryzae]MCJ8210235.1 glycosyltransferase family 4 protein [Mucilaginibacter straminoryzae]